MPPPVNARPAMPVIRATGPMAINTPSPAPVQARKPGPPSVQAHVSVGGKPVTSAHAVNQAPPPPTAASLNAAQQSEIAALKKELAGMKAKLANARITAKPMTGAEIMSRPVPTVDAARMAWHNYCTAETAEGRAVYLPVFSIGEGDALVPHANLPPQPVCLAVPHDTDWAYNAKNALETVGAFNRAQGLMAIWTAPDAEGRYTSVIYGDVAEIDALNAALSGEPATAATEADASTEIEWPLGALAAREDKPGHFWERVRGAKKGTLDWAEYAYTAGHHGTGPDRMLLTDEGLWEADPELPPPPVARKPGPLLGTIAQPGPRPKAR